MVALINMETLGITRIPIAMWRLANGPSSCIRDASRTLTVSYSPGLTRSHPLPTCSWSHERILTTRAGSCAICGSIYSSGRKSRYLLLDLIENFGTYSSFMSRTSPSRRDVFVWMRLLFFGSRG